MKTVISIISHGHSEVLAQNNWIKELNKIENVQVVIKDNLAEERLRVICAAWSVFYLDDKPGLGFGENNNFVYQWSTMTLGLTRQDYFVVMNPDVILMPQTLERFIEAVGQYTPQICTIRLFKESASDELDDSLRTFPTVSSTLKSFLGFQRRPLDRSLPQIDFDWASGAFLAFRSGFFSDLGGFDERFFMYCEDVEICWRARKHGAQIEYMDELSAVHSGARASSSLFSKHFWWHVRSMFMFWFIKAGFIAPKTQVLR